MEHIKKADKNDLDIITQLSCELWPHFSYEDLRDFFEEALISDKYHALLYKAGDEIAGFIYLSIRVDYVEGSDESPTGYVEGIYIRPQWRKKGIAQKLLAKGEEWIKERGCTQVGSDILPENMASYNFHIGSGFREANRIITFIKDL